MKIIKLHPLFGSEILSQSHALSEISHIVKHHHEWWNGKGYPANIKEEIPLLFRVLYICDAVDAMRNNRIYRSKLTFNELINQLYYHNKLDYHKYQKSTLQTLDDQ